MRKAVKDSEVEVQEVGTKIKWFKALEIHELQNAIEKGKIKIKKHVDIRKMSIIRVDHVTINIQIDDVIYKLEDNTNNNYIAEWKKGPGHFIRKDIRKGTVVLSGKEIGPYVEICYASKDGFLKKALIRVAYELTDSELTEEGLVEEIKKWDSYNILHGKIQGLYYTIIKIVGANEDYSKKEILTKDIENLEELAATTDFVEYQAEDSTVEESSNPLF